MPAMVQSGILRRKGKPPLVSGSLFQPADAVLTVAADFEDKYLDLPLGIVDAAVVAIAERLKLTEIATIDHRHFNVVRPRHVPAFALLPGSEAV